MSLLRIDCISDVPLISVIRNRCATLHEKPFSEGQPETGLEALGLASQSWGFKNSFANWASARAIDAKLGDRQPGLDLEEFAHRFKSIFASCGWTTARRSP